MFRICIATHNRETIICKKTLKFLNNTCQFKSNIYIFVPNDQIPNYKIQIGQYEFENLNILFVDSPNSLSAKINYVINDYFDHDDFVIYLEDDIESIQTLVEFNNKKHLTNILDLTKFIHRTYEILIQNDLKIFGVYAAYNPYFMYFNNSISFKFLINHFWGFIVNKHKSIIINTECKSDYEKSIIFYKEYGKILRFNHIVCKTCNYKNVGGIDNKTRFDQETESADYLLINYPDYCVIKNCKSQFTQIRLKKN